MAHDPDGWAGNSVGTGLGLSAASTDAANWSWRPEVLLPLSLLLALYGVGWWRLRRRSCSGVPTWRLVSCLAGIGTVGAALLSPVNWLAEDLFFVHMIQHLLLIKLAAPAFLLADPLPVMLWGLPAGMRVRAGRLLAPGTPLRAGWQLLTWMPLAWLTYALTLWLWHLPTAYDAALNHRLLHDAEHLAFFWAALLFWWPVIAPAPHLRPSVHHGVRIVYLVLAAFQEAVLGLLLTVIPWLLYPSYAFAPRVLALTAEQDQTWGGIVMWGAGGAIDMVAVLVMLFRLLGHEGGPASPLHRHSLLPRRRRSRQGSVPDAPSPGPMTTMELRAGSGSSPTRTGKRNSAPPEPRSPPSTPAPAIAAAIRARRSPRSPATADSKH
jgi:putative membrane protein